MKSTAEGFTKNKFVDKCVELFIPNDPLRQSQYMYYLSIVVFVGVMGYAISSWFEVFAAFEFTKLFRSIFMTAIALMVTFSLRSAKAAYDMIKKMTKGQPPHQAPLKLESKEDMLKAFS